MTTPVSIKLSGNSGFSLLEVLVAFSILAVSLGIVLKIFSSGVNTAVISEEYTVATQLAESLMAKTGVETSLEEGEEQGTEVDKYHWRVLVSSIPSPAAEQTEEDVQFMAVSVSVEWGEGENPRRVELNTLKSGMRL